MLEVFVFAISVDICADSLVSSKGPIYLLDALIGLCDGQKAYTI